MLPINKVVESVSITHKFDKPVLKFLNTSDVENGKIININHLPIDELKGQAKKTIQKHDILFSEIRPKNRRFAYVDIDDTYDYVVSTKLMVLRNINPEVDNKYFYYFLTNDHMLSILQDRAENRIGSFPQITFDLLSEYYIRVPKLAEQQKIASVLSALDSKIELNNRINAELEAMAKTLYDYWFVQFDFPDKNGKPYKTSGGKMVWNEELKREIPDLEGWSVGTLLDIATYANGLPCQKFRPTGNDYLRVIKIREMNEGFTSNSELVRPNIPEKAIIENGDVLFSWSASLEVKIWTGGKGALNQHIFKVSSGDYQKSFYYYQLLNYLQHFKMMAENRKTTMGHITQEHLQQSRIAIPPKELTKELEKIIAPIFSNKINNEIENQKLTELRDWLLPMLMNGQVKVN
jgi:type I restriction enzyme S subunit